MLMFSRQPGVVSRIELIPERRANGTVVLRVVVLSPLERLRRLLKLS
jgi:hypothetical protein